MMADRGCGRQGQMSHGWAVEKSGFSFASTQRRRLEPAHAFVAASAVDVSSYVSTGTMKHKSAFSVWRRTMHRTLFLAIVLLGCIVSTGAQMKDVYSPGVPPQPAPLDPDHGKTGPDEPKLQRRIDPVKLQRDADDLSSHGSNHTIRCSQYPPRHYYRKTPSRN